MKIKRTRNGFGTRGNEKHATNVSARAAKMRKETGLRAGLKEYRRKLGKDEAR